MRSSSPLREGELVDSPLSNTAALLELQDRINRAWMDRQHYKAYVRPIIEPEKEQDQ